MRTSGYPVATLATLVAVAVAGGCGSGGSSDPVELPGALPGDPRFVSYIDLTAAREALELPDDADPVDFELLAGSSDASPEAQLVAAAASSLPHATEPFTRRFESDPTALAIDHTQVSAAAASQDPEARSAVLQTDQPFDEVAEELEGAGFERDGDVLSGEGVDPEVAFPYVADAGDGRIVVAKELEQAEAALAGEGEPGAAAMLIEELEASQRDAASIVDPDCVTGIAIGGEPGGEELELVLTVDGDADADLVASDLELSPITTAELGDPEVEGDTVRTTLTVDSAQPFGPSDLLANGAILSDQLYDCV